MTKKKIAPLDPANRTWVVVDSSKPPIIWDFFATEALAKADMKAYALDLKEFKLRKSTPEEIAS